MLVALLSVRLADESAGFLIPGSFEAIRSELHLSYAQAATILAAGTPGAIVGNGFSIAADYVSRRVIAAGGALWFAAAVAVFATSTSYPVLVAASFVIGVAASAMVDACELALVDVSGDDLPRMLGASNLMGSIGDLAGPARHHRRGVARLRVASALPRSPRCSWPRTACGWRCHRFRRPIVMRSRSRRAARSRRSSATVASGSSASWRCSSARSTSRSSRSSSRTCSAPTACRGRSPPRSRC